MKKIFLTLNIFIIVSILNNVYAYTDLTKNLQISDYSEENILLKDITFRNQAKSNINFKYSNDLRWIKVKNLNRYQEKFIVFTSPLLDHISEFQGNLNVKKIKSFFLPFSIFKIISPKELNFKIKTRHHTNFKVLILNTVELYNYSMKHILIYSFYMGSVVILFLLALLIAMLTKNKLYYFFSVFTFCFFLLILNINGLLNYFYHFSNYLFIFSCFSLLSALYFTYLYFNNRIKNNDLIEKLFLLEMSIFVLLVIIYLFSTSSIHPILSQILDIMIGISCLTMFFTSLKFDLSKPVGERFYLYSWTIIFCSVLIYFIHRSYSTAFSFFGDYALLFANIGSFLFFFMSLIINLKELEKEKILHLFKEKNAKRYQRLVRVLVHDISNPLTLLMARLKIMHRKKSDENFLDSFDKGFSQISLATEHISGILENVKKSEKNNKDILSLVKLNTTELISKSINLLELKISEKNIKINTQFENDHMYIMGNSVTFINNILNNVLSNAIKFSIEGKDIHILCTKEQNMIVIKYIDYGVGINKSTLDKFNNNDNTVQSSIGTSGEKGTGFGLFILKDYCEIFNGKINIYLTDKSTELGTTVELRFPCV